MSETKNPIIKIETERLLLRQYIEEDLDPIQAITLQPEIIEFLPDWIGTREQREVWLTKYEISENRAFMDAMPQIGENIARFVIVLKETGKVIGWITSGLKDEVPAPNREIGYAISNEYTCKGYATEAVKAFTQFLFDNTDTTEIVAVARVYNAPSNRVIQKSGFTYIGVLKIDGYDEHYYRMKKA